MTALDDALNSTAPMFHPPTITADWVELPPGYASNFPPNDSLRDLSPQIGDGGLTVVHSLDDGLPDSVTMTGSNDAAGVLTMDLVGRPPLQAQTFAVRTPLSGTGTGTAITASAPVDVQVGDFMIAAVTVNSTATLADRNAVADGYGAWKLLATATVGTCTTWVWGRYWFTGSGSFIGDLPSSQAFSWVSCAFGARTAGGDVVEVSCGTPVVTVENVSRTTHTAAALTRKRRGWNVGIWSMVAATAQWTAGAGSTELAEAASTVDVMMSATPFIEGAPTLDVTAVTASATALTTMIGLPLLVMDRVQMEARQFFSTFNTASPIATFGRDTAPVAAAVNVVTATGVVSTQVFKGVMADTPISGRDVELQAISKARIDLNRSLELPVVSGNRENLSVDWLVTWLAARGGKFAGVAPTINTRYWAPLYGSTHAHYDTPYGYNSAVYYTAAAPGYGLKPPSVVAGPFVSAMYGQQTATRTEEIRLHPDRMDLVSEILPHWGVASRTLPDMFSLASSKGRISFWLRGDPVTSAPAYLSSPNDFIFDMKFQITDRYGNFMGYVRCAIGSSDRKAVVQMGSSIGVLGYPAIVYNTPGTLPTDGSWNFWSFIWDYAAGTAAVIQNGTGTSSNYWFTNATNVTSGLPDTDASGLANSMAIDMNVRVHVPVSDFLYESGPVYVNSSSWSDIYPTPTTGSHQSIVMRPTMQTMEALAEPSPVNAWDTIADLARNSLSMYRLDELERLNFLPMSYFGEAAQLTPSLVADTQSNASDLDISQDLTKIRNVTTLTFRESMMTTQYQPILQLFTAVEIPRGTNQITFTLDTPAAEIHGQSAPFNPWWTLTNLTDVQVFTPTIPTNVHFMTVNTQADGLGTTLSVFAVKAKIVSADASTVTIEFNSPYAAPVYLANNGVNVPFLQILGYAVKTNEGYETQRDATSIALRRERSLEADMHWIQKRSIAADIAQKLVIALGRPRPELGITVMGDPRRAPGQLVTIVDAEGTGAAGTWRILAINHHNSGPKYTQDLQLVYVQPTALWDGIPGWDTGNWGP
jgi:hypothetical protein